MSSASRSAVGCVPSRRIVLSGSGLLQPWPWRRPAIRLKSPGGRPSGPGTGMALAAPRTSGPPSLLGLRCADGTCRPRLDLSRLDDHGARRRLPDSVFELAVFQPGRVGTGCDHYGPKKKELQGGTDRLGRREVHRNPPRSAAAVCPARSRAGPSAPDYKFAKMRWEARDKRMTNMRQMAESAPVDNSCLVQRRLKMPHVPCFWITLQPAYTEKAGRPRRGSP